MTYLNHTIELLIGGEYIGNQTWNGDHTEADNCFKLYNITKGTLFISGDDQTHVLEEGRFYFINGSRMKSYWCEDSFSTRWLHFVSKDLTIQHALLSAPVVVEIPPGTFNANTPLDVIYSLISHPEKSNPNKHLLSSLQLQVHIQAVICWILKEVEWDHHQQTKIINSILPAVKHIDKYFSQQIRLKYLAELCCMSTNYFHKLFTQSLHVTPTNYIIQQRMNRAISLLKQHDQSIKEVAYQLGYCNDAYFSKSFKNYYGITPGEYQKKGDGIFFRTKELSKFHL